MFFAGSDDEGEPGSALVDKEQPPVPVVESGRDHQKALFFADSSDEEENSRVVLSRIPLIGDTLEDDAMGLVEGVELPQPEEVPRASSISSVSSGHVQRLPSPASLVRSDEPPQKKRRLSPAGTDSQVQFSSTYLGSFLVGNAWSTVRGSGYVKPGDEIYIERDTSEGLAPNDSKRSKTKDTKGKGGKKQLNIATMLRVQPSKAIKKKQDLVVRLTNKKGFEFGRLPQDVSTWVSKLLDLDIVDFRGSTMIDCPATLHSGADLIVSLSVYIKASAFKPSGTSSDEKVRVMFNEGQETASEQLLRERKASLLSLFDIVGLKPRKGNGFARKPHGDLDQKDLELLTQRAATRGKKPIKTEIVGDGEEVEVESEGEELSDNELNLIYKRAQQNDQQLGEMEPANTFTLKLRGYQKQALLWMHSIEMGARSARGEQSMDPLWKEYLFPPEPSQGIVDLTTDDKVFYFNEYSGELSLEFPKAERKCRGGILAYVTPFFSSVTPN
ncbi:hypothetical protein AcW1_001224 [Taiwanofungus camphoratus]|nr:hypothetical protein AcW2_000268 [Antrodia cinnamomea]KAI0964394.1 hypothetical protein AcW1_001224 [Antrodia cinnamomea]